MNEKFYFDTSIWLDFFEDRNEPNLPKSDWARKLVTKEGLLVGGSGAAAVIGGLRIAKKLSKKDVLVVLIPDSGRSYLSKIYL